jgi:hypothetical protein
VARTAGSTTYTTTFALIVQWGHDTIGYRNSLKSRHLDDPGTGATVVVSGATRSWTWDKTIFGVI